MIERIAIVTGAASKRGIGRAIATELAKKGATVIIADINESGAIQAANELKESGYNVVGSKANWYFTRSSSNSCVFSIRRSKLYYR